MRPPELRFSGSLADADNELVAGVGRLRARSVPDVGGAEVGARRCDSTCPFARRACSASGVATVTGRGASLACVVERPAAASLACVVERPAAASLVVTPAPSTPEAPVATLCGSFSEAAAAARSGTAPHSSSSSTVGGGVDEGFMPSAGADFDDDSMFGAGTDFDDSMLGAGTDFDDSMLGAGTDFDVTDAFISRLLAGASDGDACVALSTVPGSEAQPVSSSSKEGGGSENGFGPAPPVMDDGGAEAETDRADAPVDTPDAGDDDGTGTDGTGTDGAGIPISVPPLPRGRCEDRVLAMSPLAGGVLGLGGVMPMSVGCREGRLACRSPRSEFGGLDGELLDA